MSTLPPPPPQPTTYHRQLQSPPLTAKHSSAHALGFRHAVVTGTLSRTLHHSCSCPAIATQGHAGHPAEASLRTKQFRRGIKQPRSPSRRALLTATGELLAPRLTASSGRLPRLQRNLQSSVSAPYLRDLYEKTADAAPRLEDPVVSSPDASLDARLAPPETRERTITETIDAATSISIELALRQLPPPRSLTRLQTQETLEVLRNSPVFCGCSTPDLRCALRLAEPRQLQRYAILARQGTTGDTFHLLLQGELHCFDDTGAEWIVSQGSCVGDAQLRIRSPRTATVVANAACRLLSWRTSPIRSLRGLQLDDANIAIAMQALRHLPVFKQLNSVHLRELAAKLPVHERAEGTVIWGARDSDERLFIVLEGEVSMCDEAPVPQAQPDEPSSPTRPRKSVTMAQQAKPPVAAMESAESAWRGEMAVWSRRKPNKIVTGAQRTVILALGQAEYSQFIADSLEFSTAVQNTQTNFKRFTRIAAAKQDLRRNSSALRSTLSDMFCHKGRANLSDHAAGSTRELGSTFTASRLVQRWETLVRTLLLSDSPAARMARLASRRALLGPPPPTKHSPSFFLDIYPDHF